MCVTNKKRSEPYMLPVISESDFRLARILDHQERMIVSNTETLAAMNRMIEAHEKETREKLQRRYKHA